MPLTLHGRIANQPAHYVEVMVNLDPPHELSVAGRVAEGGLFFPHLHLVTTISTLPGWNRFVVHDVVENRGGQPAEMQMLYHCNIGPPFLEAGSRILAPFRELSPISHRAAQDIDSHKVCLGPTAGLPNRFVLQPGRRCRGHSSALLHNARGDRAVQMRWNREELPCFTVWKNTAAIEDGYVAGLEPGTNYPNLRSFERKHGRVRRLDPGSRWECTWSLEVLEGREEIARNVAVLEELHTRTKGIVHRTPQTQMSGQA